MNAEDIARARVIERLELANGKGEIWAGGKIFRVTYDDVLDLVQAVEMVMLKLTGKVLNPKLRPKIVSREGLAIDKLVAGGADLYDGETGEAPIGVGPWWLMVEINGTRWDNWVGRLDELVKCLYIVVREAQGDVYKPRPAIVVPEAVGHA